VRYGTVSSAEKPPASRKDARLPPSWLTRELTIRVPMPSAIAASTGPCPLSDTISLKPPSSLLSKVTRPGGPACLTALATSSLTTNATGTAMSVDTLTGSTSIARPSECAGAGDVMRSAFVRVKAACSPGFAVINPYPHATTRQSPLPCQSGNDRFYLGSRQELRRERATTAVHAATIKAPTAPIEPINRESGRAGGSSIPGRYFLRERLSKITFTSVMAALDAAHVAPDPRAATIAPIPAASRG
jgi:hypothetical protein